MSDKLGDIIKEIFAKRKEKAALEHSKKQVQAEIDELEYKAQILMDEQALDSIRTDSGTVTRKIELYPNVVDKQAFVEYCVANARLDLLVIQANRGTFREFYENMNEYPEGLDAFEKVGLNYRAR